MSLGPRYGICFHCGYDHGEPASFFSPDMERMAAAHATEMKGKVERIAELERENAELRMALKEARRAIGGHYAPNDCYATGPLTGNEYRDLVECPACSFIALYDSIASAPHQPDSGENA